MNRWQARFASVLVSVWLTGCAVAPALPSEQRPHNWAQKVGSVELRTDARLPNLYQVSPVLYRSAQPGVDGLEILNQKLARRYGLPAEIKMAEAPIVIAAGGIGLGVKLEGVLIGHHHARGSIVTE